MVELYLHLPVYCDMDGATLGKQPPPLHSDVTGDIAVATQQ
jgi:hypothetical protein